MKIPMFFVGKIIVTFSFKYGYESLEKISGLWHM